MHGAPDISVSDLDESGTLSIGANSSTHANLVDSVSICGPPSRKLLAHFAAATTGVIAPIQTWASSTKTPKMEAGEHGLTSPTPSGT